MKKTQLLLLFFISIILTACSANMEEEPQDVFESTITYNYQKATFNNTSSSGLLENIEDYEKEFFYVIELANSYGYLTTNWEDNEENAYRSFFKKLENIDHHSYTIFDMDSSELTALFEANNEVITAIDIFTFNAIKNIFDSLEDYNFDISNEDYIELLLERDLSDEEISAFQLLYEIQRNLYGETLLQGSIENTIGVIENRYMTLTDEQKEQIEIAYNILDSLQHKGEE